MDKKSRTELEFEREVIEYLTQIGGVKQWDYLPEIKTTDQLWDNFKKILERNNQGKLDYPLSDVEFSQIKKVINNLDTPYKAGQFLYGVNGVSEIEINLDNGRHVFLKVFDQAQVGGGDTVYQVVNQISREKVIDGKRNCRFDVTLLINGLPIIQIELKKETRTSSEALNQMEQYIADKQYTDIFSTLQILVAMTPYDIRYMANTKKEMFNRAFAFNWQDEETSEPIRLWKSFLDKVLSIPMAHNLATRFMILDGTKNKETLKVMRPYQVYATKRVLEKVRTFDFKYSDGKLGYIWHTTGSGKTITSFKTAWLASRLPNVDKVIFLVDRIALTNQTVEAYQAYDPIAKFDGKEGVVGETVSTKDLHRKLTQKTNKNIIVTSIQKMARYVAREDYKRLDSRILFIVDEAHRSTGSKEETGMLQSIRNAIHRSAWIGYTGTPKFPETKDIFGELIHAYTIKEAIADRNVLGFKVEFKETIRAPQNPTEEDVDDAIKASIYDTSGEHVKLVVKDILDNWKSRSNNKRYNALFTVHVGGNKASSPRVMQYFDEFMQENEKKPEEDRLKIAVSYSMDTSNGDNQLLNNKGLFRVMKNYNDMFNTNFDMTTVSEYTDDLAKRLNKSASDRKYLDLVIVIDQLLTGFDAPELNTLYVDRTLKDGNLIQAYSRTNRIHDRDKKPQGNIVNYRWPIQNEEYMNKAFARYSNTDSAFEQQSLEDLRDENTRSGILAKEYPVLIKEMRKLIVELRESTSGFVQLPPSEAAQDKLFDDLRVYNRLINQIKQYPYDEQTQEGYLKEDIYSKIGITEEEATILTVVLSNELRRKKAKKEEVDISQIDLVMTHIQDVEINYDYLIELIAKMANEIHENKSDEANRTKCQINRELEKTKDEKERARISEFVEQIYIKEHIFDTYPVSTTVSDMHQEMEKAQERIVGRKISEFINHWGLIESTSAGYMKDLVNMHQLGVDDLDKQGKLNELMFKAKEKYKKYAVIEIAELTWIDYRNQLREAAYKLAEEIKEKE